MIRKILCIICVLLSYSIFSQDDLNGYFSVGPKKITITLQNSTDTIVDLPNSIRNRWIRHEMIERNDTTLVLIFNHNNKGPKVHVQHGVVVEEGVLAFEELDSNRNKSYTSLLPKMFRRKLRRIREVILVFGGSQRYTLQGITAC